MPLFNNPDFAVGRTKFFRHRKSDGAQDLANRVTASVEQVKGAADAAMATVLKAKEAAANLQQQIGEAARPGADTLAGRIAAARAGADQTKGAVDQAGQSALAIRDATTAIKVQVGTKDNPSPDSLLALVSVLKDIATLPPDPSAIPAKMAERFFVCIRALNRIEDLVADKKFVLGTNNTEILKFLGDQLGTACLDALASSPPELLDEVRKVHEKFADSSAQLRLKRLAALHRLRQQIIGYFVSDQDSHSGGEASPGEAKS